MKKLNLVKTSLFNTLGIIIYVGAVALIIHNGENIFGKMQNLLSQITFLLLFVISAAIMGILFFGKPVQLYLNEQKSEAIKLIGYTIGWLALAIVIAMIILII